MLYVYFSISISISNSVSISVQILRFYGYFCRSSFCFLNLSDGRGSTVLSIFIKLFTHKTSCATHTQFARTPVPVVSVVDNFGFFFVFRCLCVAVLSLVLCSYKDIHKRMRTNSVSNVEKQYPLPFVSSHFNTSCGKNQHKQFQTLSARPFYYCSVFWLNCFCCCFL